MKFTISMFGAILVVLVAAACGSLQEQEQEREQELATSSFKVRMTFVGLAAFAPGGAGERAHYLLVDTISKERKDTGRCTVPWHLPIMRVYGASCDGDCFGGWQDLRELLANDDHFKTYEKWTETGPELKAGWYLKRKHVEFPQTTPGWTGVETEGPLSRLPTPENAHDHRWLVRPNPGNVLDDCLQEASQCPVVARVALGQGQLATCSLAAEKEDDEWYIASYEFKTLLDNSKPIPLNQATADSMVYEMDVPGEHLELVLKSFDDLQARVTTLSLAPKDDLIEIVFANVMFHETPVVDGCSALKVDRHSELYYELTDNKGPKYIGHATSNRILEEGIQPDETCSARLGDQDIVRPRNTAVCGHHGLFGS